MELRLRSKGNKKLLGSQGDKDIDTEGTAGESPGRENGLPLEGPYLRADSGREAA